MSHLAVSLWAHCVCETLKLYANVFHHVVIGLSNQVCTQWRIGGHWRSPAMHDRYEFLPVCRSTYSCILSYFL